MIVQFAQFQVFEEVAVEQGVLLRSVSTGVQEQVLILAIVHQHTFLSLLLSHFDNPVISEKSDLWMVITG